MGQINAKWRRQTGGNAHWCPGCEEIHTIPDSWSFNGNYDSPTFAPSVKHTGKQIVRVNGEWTGEWVRGPDGRALDEVCHYWITDGVIKYEADCTHDHRGRSIPVPDLPSFLKD